MVRTVTSAVTVVFVSTAVLCATHTASQTPADQHATSSTGSSASPSSLTLTGCIARGPDGKGFVLTTESAGTPGSATSPMTSAAAGTSATGTAASGSVTGDTPTGATATETAAPTPAVGEPGTKVSPASPTYNQSQGAAGTSGTVARADTAGAAKASASYRLRASKSVDLAAHVGHTVEVRGVLARDPRAGEKSPASESQADRHSTTPELTVQSLTHRAETCTR